MLSQRDVYGQEKKLDPLVKKHRIEEHRISQLKEMFVSDKITFDMFEENIIRALKGLHPINEYGQSIFVKASRYELCRVCF